MADVKPEPATVECPSCEGTGADRLGYDIDHCDICGGSGVVPMEHYEQARIDAGKVPTMRDYD